MSKSVTEQGSSAYVEPQIPGARPARCNLIPLFEKLNYTYFGATLPAMPVVFNNRLKRVYGRCHSIRKKRKWVPIKIDIQYPIASQRMLRKVLVHEMCHAWNILQHQERGHGKRFWEKMSECGYPDGHHFANALLQERDKYESNKANYSFEVGQQVFFVSRKKKEIHGRIISINKRTITVHTGLGKYRVSPSLLTLATK